MKKTCETPVSQAKSNNFLLVAGMRANNFLLVAKHALSHLSSPGRPTNLNRGAIP